MRSSTWLWSLGLHGAAVGLGLAIVGAPATEARPTAELTIQASEPVAPERPRPPLLEVEPEPPTTEMPEVTEPVLDFLIDVEPRPIDPRRPDAPLTRAARDIVRPAPPTPVPPTETPPEQPDANTPVVEPAQDQRHAAPAPWVPAVAHSDNAPPRYPERCRRQGVEGTVLLRLHIDDTGGVTEVSVLERASRLLDRAAIAAARKWRFEPAREHGAPVDSVLDKQVVFQLR